MSLPTPQPERTQGKVYFASDMHFGSRHHSDPIGVERLFALWLDKIAEDAMALYLVGDIFDYWFEYRDVIPKGFSRVLGGLARLADRGVSIHFFTGNHDIWVRNYFEKEFGATIHTEPLETQILGRTFHIAHGDEYDHRKRSFRILRSIFHNKVCIALFAAIHPRWTVGLAQGWSRSSREKGLKRHAHPESFLNDYRGEDQEYLVQYAKEYLRRKPDSVDFFVFGHRHILLDLMLTRRTRVVVLGDWLSYFSYAVWDGNTLSVEEIDLSVL